MALPIEMARRLREYLHQQKGSQLRDLASSSLLRLSTPLQIEVVLHCHRHWLDAIWFLRDFEEICRVRLAMSMGSQVLAPGEVAPQRNLYVISRGLVLCAPAHTELADMLIRARCLPSWCRCRCTHSVRPIPTLGLTSLFSLLAARHLQSAVASFRIRWRGATMCCSPSLRTFYRISLVR